MSLPELYVWAYRHGFHYLAARVLRTMSEGVA